MIYEFNFLRVNKMDINRQNMVNINFVSVNDEFY